MASEEYLIISSSPPRGISTFDMTSSPLLPSLNDLFGIKKPQILRTGNRAAIIPSNASASFTTATSLLKTGAGKDTLSIASIRAFRLGSESDISEGLPEVVKPKPRKTTTKKVDTGEPKVAKKPRKAVEKKDDTVGDTTVIKKPRKPRVKKTDANGEESAKVAPRKSKINKADALAEAEDGTKAPPKPRRKKNEKTTAGVDVPKEKAPRKSKKTDEESQTKLARGKVTKSASLSDGKEKGTGHLPDPIEDSLDFGLDEAVKRRVAWTPPIQTANAISLVTPGSALGSIEMLSSGAGKKGFTDLFGSFGFTKSGATIVAKSIPVEGMRKRKLIELVKTTVSAAEPTKEKTVKKKVKTITEHATSAYVDENDPTKSAPLLQYFSRPTEERTAIGGFKFPRKSRSRSPTKKGSANAPILLSPASVLQSAGNQDFVFGTSSQLAREDSPTFLKEIHEAMQASNQSRDDDSFASDLDTSRVPGMKSKATSTKRNLWAAAARDVAGDLHDVDMIDLVDSPAVLRKSEIVALPSAIKSLETTQCDDWPDIDDLDKTLTQKPKSIQQPALEAVLSDDWHDIDELDMTSNPKLQTTQSPTKPIGPIEASITSKLLDSPSNRTLKASAKPPKKDDSPTKEANSVTNTKIVASKDPAMPDYTTFTDAQLAKQLKAYHFKPIKGRDAMISMLERCWEGKQRTAFGNLGTNAMLTTMSDKVTQPATVEASPKRSRGRPRKDSIAAVLPNLRASRAKKPDTVEYLEMGSDTPVSQIRTPKKSRAKQPVEDISDSDTPITPSPPRRRSSQIKTPPLPLQLSTNLESSPEPSPSELQEKLFKHISQAVRSATPAKDSKNPGWHEKILLYDPIVLEDLTIWLNTGALEKVGWDGEVEPKEVKKWCESKSVCCLWRENLRGGARSRY